MSTFTKSFCLLTIAFTALLASCQSNPPLKEGEGYVEVKGGKVWYRVLGEGNTTPILMCHGGPGGTSRSFYQFEPITEDRPIIIFDQLGSGRSDHHEDTSLLKVENFVEQVEALRKKLGLKEYYLHGHSWGTALSLETYLKYPDGIKAIVFNSPYFSTSVWEADADTLITYLHDTIQKAIEIGEKTGDFTSDAYLHANTVFAKHYGVRNSVLKSELDTVPAPWSHFIYNYMWGPTEFTAAGTLKKYHRIESLKTIKVPTLFITGEFDEARPVTVKHFQSLVPDAKFAMIDGAGHGTMHDNREQNIKVIRDFLNELESN